MISSPKNPIIQHIRNLQGRVRTRRDEQQFVVEGIRLVEEALRAGIIPHTLIYTPSIDDRGEQLLADFHTQGVDPVPVTESVMQTASDTKTPQGILAVLPIQPRTIPVNLTFTLILDRVRDPGNLGTILRTAAAAGVQAILLPPDTTDPYSPKVVRAGMGAHFQVAIYEMDWNQIRETTQSMSVFLADGHGQNTYTETDFTHPLALVIGGEAHGASPDLQSLNPTPIRIPMPGGSESLNAAIAAGILIFEVVRQRNKP